MKTNEKLEILKTEINERIADLKKKRLFNKKMSHRLKILSVLFAAIITVLLGLQGLGQVVESFFKNVALMLGASIIVVNACEAFYDHRSLWINQTVTLSLLQNLRRDIDFYASGMESTEIEIKRLEEFHERYNRILQDDLRDWLKLKRETERPSDSNVSIREVTITPK